MPPGVKLDPMLECKHLLKRHAARRVMDLLTVRLAEIPPEGRAIYDGYSRKPLQMPKTGLSLSTAASMMRVTVSSRAGSKGPVLPSSAP